MARRTGSRTFMVRPPILSDRPPATITPTVREIVKRDYSLTGAESRRAVELGLSQAQWYRTDVSRKRMKELMQRRNGPAIRDTLLWLALLIVFGGLGVYLWFSVWSLLCFAVYGVLYGSASDARWHECGHGTAFRTRWMNSVVYEIACFMIMRDPTVWRWSHARHHTDTIIVGRDAAIARMRPPDLLRAALAFTGILDFRYSLPALVRQAFGTLSDEEKSYIPEMEQAKAITAARWHMAVYVETIPLAIALRSWLPLVLIGLP